jgi:26S proteasome regulatory subunit N12
MSLGDFATLLKDFQAHVDSSDFDKASSALSKLKIHMTQLSSLPPCGQPASDAAQQECMLGRQTLEHAALLSVKMADMVAFECHVAQLKPYYTDAGSSGESAMRYPILAMNLLHLLVDNRLAEFHSELELIPDDGRSNEAITFVVQLEQYLMEGSYSKVMNAKASCPQQFTYFMEGLVNRIRDAVAECSEVAYKKLSLSEAKRLLDFNSDQEVLDYIDDAEKSWTVKDGTVFFQDIEKSIGSQDIPSMRLITESLQYCVELERIV